MDTTTTTPATTTKQAAQQMLNALAGMVQHHSPEESAEALTSLIRDNEASHNDKARFVMSLLIVASELASAFSVDAVNGSEVASQQDEEDDENALIKVGVVLGKISASANLDAEELCNISDTIPHTIR